MCSASMLIIETRNCDSGIAIIKLCGEVNVFTSTPLKQVLINQLNGGTRKIILDLTELTYFESIGFGIVIGGRNRALEAEGDLVLVNSRHQKVRRVFIVLDFGKEVDIHESLEDAIEALKKLDIEKA